MGIRYPYWGIEPFKVVNQIKHGGLTTEHEILVPKMGRAMQGDDLIGAEKMKQKIEGYPRGN